MSNYLGKLSSIFRPFKPHSRQSFKVFEEGEFLRLNFSGTEITVHYRDALKIGSIIHHNAKQCKRKNHDYSRDFIVLGDLRTAEENDKHVISQT